MNTFLFALNSVMPVITVILLGYYLGRCRFLSNDFLKNANKLVFRVTLPIYLYYNIYSLDDLTSVNKRLVIYTMLFIFIVFALAFLCVCLYTKDNKKRGALLQCTFRSNFAIIGVTLAEAMGGAQAVACAAVISAFSIPVFNILAVVCLTIFDGNDNKRINFKKILKGIATNPLIIGVMLGILTLLARKFIPIKNGEHIFTIQKQIPFLYKAVKSIGGVASPLALMVLGGQFKFSAVKELAKDIIFGTIWRLILTPLIAIGGLILFSRAGILSVSPTEMPAVIALYCSPVAVSSAIMAEEMNSHGELARQLVVWTSLLSILTMFITVALFKGLGML